MFYSISITIYKLGEMQAAAGIGQLSQDVKQPSKWSCFLDPENDNN